MDVTVNAVQASAPATALVPIRARLRKFNCDRRLQRAAFAEAIEAALHKRLSWPQVVVTIGRDCDCVETFVERLHTEDLYTVLRGNQFKPDVVWLPLEWSLDDEEDHLGDDAESRLDNKVTELQKAVAQSLGLPRTASRRSIVRELSSDNAAFFFEFDINGQNYNAEKHACFTRAIDWWNELSTEISTQLPIIVMPWFNLRQRSMFALFEKDRAKSISSQMQKIADAPRFRNRLTVLKPLGLITHQDAIDWLNENKREAAEQPSDYAAKVRNFFSSRFGAERAVTMSEASCFFGGLVDDMQILSRDVTSESGRT